MLRMSILSHMKTDNVLLDILLGGILMAVVNKVIEWLFKINFWTLLQHTRIRWTRYNEIIMVRNEFVSTSAWDCRFAYPKSILAIYNHIRKKNIVQNGSIRHLDHNKDFPINKSAMAGAHYQIDSRTPIEVAPSVFFKTYWDENGRLVSDNNKGDRMIEHKYSLYSFDHSVHQLMTLLNAYIEDYERDTIINMNKKPCYFMYNSKSDGMLYFDEYALDHDRTFDNVFLDQKEELMNRLDFFQHNREWYRAKGIPYTLGIMFSGRPGCGKTSTIKAIAKFTDRHVVDVSLSKIDNCRDLMNIFYSEEINGKKIPINKRIYLFEDIDSILDVLKERKTAATGATTLSDDEAVMVNMTELKSLLLDSGDGGGGGGKKDKDKEKDKDKLNLGFFLNLLDGVLETPGRILIISTNHPDKLDRALVRPGRVDLKIHMDMCSPTMIRDIIHHYYFDEDKSASASASVSVSEALVAHFHAREITPAELYQICFKYKTFEAFHRDLEQHGNFDTVFGRCINRKEEELLLRQKLLLSRQKHTGGGGGGGGGGGAKNKQMLLLQKQRQRNDDIGGGGGGGGGGYDDESDEL